MDVLSSELMVRLFLALGLLALTTVAAAAQSWGMYSRIGLQRAKNLKEPCWSAAASKCAKEQSRKVPASSLCHQNGMEWSRSRLAEPPLLPKPTAFGSSVSSYCHARSDVRRRPRQGPQGLQRLALEGETLYLENASHEAD